MLTGRLFNTYLRSGSWSRSSGTESIRRAPAFARSGAPARPAKHVLLERERDRDRDRDRGPSLQDEAPRPSTGPSKGARCPRRRRVEPHADSAGDRRGRRRRIRDRVVGGIERYARK